MAKQWRPSNQQVRVTLGEVDTSVESDATLSDYGHNWYSELDTVLQDAVPAKTYATCEPGRALLGGQLICPPQNISEVEPEGFVSSQQAAEDGSYAEPTGISITLSREHTLSGLVFTFDRSTGDYPTELRVLAYEGSTVVTDELVYPTAADFSIDTVLGNVDRIDILITKASAYGRRARIQHITAGDGIVFTITELKKTSQHLEVDPITRRQPDNRFSFTVLNYSGAYNMDNPTGVWQKIEDRSHVRVEYGVEIDTEMTWDDIASSTWDEVNEMTWGGMTRRIMEWLPGGSYFTDGKPSAKGYEATFSCVTVLDMMTGTYYKGKFGATYNLMAIATDVLTDANLPLTLDGEQPWVLWPGLSAITTTAPVPLKTHREILQYIAHMAQCVLYVDRAGYIHIEPISFTQYDFYADFMNQMSLPSVSKIEALSVVNANVYRYLKTTDSAIEIHQESYDVSGSRNVHVEFSGPHTNVSYSVNRGSVSAVTYASAADVTLTGTGTITLTIKGRPVDITTTSTKSTEVPDPGANALEENIDNPLITDEARARSVAEWEKAYLLLRTTYEAPTRGNPELDPLDQIWAQSLYTEKFPARALVAKLDYSGAFSGNLTLKKLEGG